MESREKASNSTETLDQEVIDVEESKKTKGQNEFFGDFLTEKEVEKERNRLLQLIEKYQVFPKEDKKDQKSKDQEEIDKLKKEIGLTE